MTAPCADCGALYDPTASGRLNHRMLHGHPPVEVVKPAPLPQIIAPYCRRDRHILCGGGVAINGWAHECSCHCHEDGGAA